MSEANQCGLRCPYTTVTDLTYEHFTEGSDTAQRLSVGAAAGVIGVQQILRAKFSCPRRRQPAETWQPSDRCVAETERIIEEARQLGRPFTPATMSEHQRVVLGPYLPETGAPSEETELEGQQALPPAPDE